MAELHGTLEACGCNPQSVGSIDRLAAAVAISRQSPRPSLVIAFGHLFTSEGDPGPAREQDEIHAALLRELLPRLGIGVVAPSADDWSSRSSSIGALRKAGASVLHLGETARSGEARPPTAALLQRVGALSVGIVAATARAQPGELAAELQRLRFAGAQLTVLLTVSEPLEPMRGWPDAGAPDLVLSAAPPPEAAGRPQRVVSARALRVPASAQGLLLIDIDDSDPSGARSGGGELRVQASRVTLTADSPRDFSMRAALDGMFERVNQRNARPAAQGGDAAVRTRFVGSDTCAACHTAAYLWWRGTAHARAFETLQRRHRQLDLDCIGCHVTGFGRPGGATLSDYAHLEGVGCESCHGPGEQHAAAPSVAHSIQRDAPAAVCERCHRAPQSPGFAYEAARPHILCAAHGGKEYE